MTKDNVTKLEIPSNEIKQGSLVRLKSGSPSMTVSRIKNIFTCTFFDVEKGVYQEYDFYDYELEPDAKKVDQSKF